ncbi:hypothetical protein ACIOHC_41225 [Streptomyces sp. NPDC088252]|uniref:hypothetical protein n=1 Tax=unclassified Streptomyces TaxID=2593676 RepID=UPI00343BDBDB
MAKPITAPPTAELTTAVLLTVPTPHEPVTGQIGTLTVPWDGKHIDETELRVRLGELLEAAGQYLKAGGQLSQPSPG